MAVTNIFRESEGRRLDDFFLKKEILHYKQSMKRLDENKTKIGEKCTASTKTRVSKENTVFKWFEFAIKCL